MMYIRIENSKNGKFAKLMSIKIWVVAMNFAPQNKRFFG